jgi:O-antigen ligase
MAMNLAFVVLTSSRKALVLLPVSLGLYYLLKSESWLKLLGKVLVVIAIVAVLWIALTKIPFLYNLGGNRLEQLANTVFNEEKADGSTAFRFQLVEWGIDWFKQKPVLGYGADNYRVLVGHLDTWAGAGGTYAHNNFIELLVDVGLVGFIIYYSMYFDVLRRFRKVVINKNSQKLIMGCIFIALFISEYGIVSYNDKYIQLFYAIAWFTMCCPEKEENRIV